MQTKTEQAVSFWESGDKVKALSLFAKFRLGLTSEEKEVLSIAYEMNTVGRSMYEKFGYDKADMMAKARDIIQQKFLKTDEQV